MYCWLRYYDLIIVVDVVVVVYTVYTPVPTDISLEFRFTRYYAAALVTCWMNIRLFQSIMLNDVNCLSLELDPIVTSKKCQGCKVTSCHKKTSLRRCTEDLFSDMNCYIVLSFYGYVYRYKKCLNSSQCNRHK
ncbi:hypothetical protein QTP88_007450 [Uroleucon formosanum]